MPCCASYFSRFETDHAGKVGTKLQKHLFVLLAIAVFGTFISSPAAWLAAIPTIVLYVVGIKGAQQRHKGYLRVYGLGMTAFLTGCVMMLVFGGILLVVMASSHYDARALAASSSFSHSGGMHEHMTMMGMKVAHDNGWVFVDGETTSDDGVSYELIVLVPEDQPQEESDDLILVDEDHVADDGTPFELITIRNQEDESAQEAELASELELVALEDPDLEFVSLVDPREEGGETDGDQVRPVSHTMRITPFGQIVIAMVLVAYFAVFYIKVVTIRLAFDMRNRLVALERQRLPVSAARTRATGPVIRPPAHVAPVAAHARQCQRCTFLNNGTSSRCAMCDNALPVVQAPVIAPPSSIPRVYVPGSMYPLNQL